MKIKKLLTLLIILLIAFPNLASASILGNIFQTSDTDFNGGTFSNTPQ